MNSYKLAFQPQKTHHENYPSPPFKILGTLSFFLLVMSTNSFAQQAAKWSLDGNTTSNGDFLGTINNEPLIFRTNNTEVMRLKPDGNLRLNSLSGFGDGLVIVNNNGTLG
ncbi:hypothetical protein BH09BAC5_BH09BAC5_26400 [soil metagenome]